MYHIFFVCKNVRSPQKIGFCLLFFLETDAPNATFSPPSFCPLTHRQDKLRYLTRFLEKIQESTHATALRTPGRWVVASWCFSWLPGVNVKVLTKATSDENCMKNRCRPKDPLQWSMNFGKGWSMLKFWYVNLYRMKHEPWQELGFEPHTLVEVPQGSPVFGFFLWLVRSRDFPNQHRAGQ